jgi:hypothetical protein
MLLVKICACNLRSFDSMAGVVRVFFVPAIVCDSTNDLFGVISAGQGAFRKGPVAL